MGIVTIDGIPVYQALVDSADTGMLRISLVDDPAVQSNFVAFSKQERAAAVPQMYAVQDEEKRLVLGCVMRADFPIYRRDTQADGTEFEFYIIYKADTIRTMAEKYLAENRQNLVNLMHQEETDQDGVQMVQYFIKGNGLAPVGFEDIADGSLFAEFHIVNDDVWETVKAGTYKGFSLEGVFDLAPEKDRASVEEIVDALDGIFSRILRNNQTYQKMKKKGILARLAAMLVEMGNVTTDKGILAWDGDADLKAGDAVFIEDKNGNRTPAADGEYTTGEGKVIVVAGGKVAEIRDAAAPAPAEPAAQEPVVQSAFQRVAQAFQETYNDKANALVKAIEEMGFAWPWIIEAGDEFVIASVYNSANDEEVFYRFNIKEWTEEGTPVLENGVKVVPAFVTPEEKEEAEENFRNLQAENADLKAQVETLRATPAAQPAHETFEGAAVVPGKTGDKGLDRLARYMSAK